MTTLIEYVLGFLFSPDRARVVLLEKARPAWQRGRLNGVGGHIDGGETPEAAMVREAREETGIRDVTWEHFATMEADAWRVYVYRAFDAQIDAASGRVDEPVRYCDPSCLPPGVIPNLRWLVPLALDAEIVAPVVLRYGR